MLGGQVDIVVGNEFTNEYYHCQTCKTFHSRKELKELREEKNHPNGRWKCLGCKEDFQIYTQLKRHSRYMVLERKLVKDLEIGDEVVFTIGNFDVHELMKKTESNNGQVHLSFSGYGSSNENEDDWVNCYIGNWDGDTSRFK
ncbi:hypothetical protein ACH0BP_29855 [Bacillus nitratireducens]|uniref:hypothetical protein n=1 Tax=Bacillus nitratireducens TaxID=2026193 RepID=UPI0008FE48E4|nr:hypothetical protein [Bacillus nitratireducens]OJD43429.1 hypothetical protein BAU23_19690 [Bacillus nitratireducens]